MAKVIIYWITRHVPYFDAIVEKFGMQRHMSVNRETEADIKEEDMELLRECERRGLIKIRIKK